MYEEIQNIVLEIPEYFETFSEVGYVPDYQVKRFSSSFITSHTNSFKNPEHFNTENTR